MQLNDEERAFLDLPVNSVLKRNFGVMANAIARESDRGAVKQLHLDFLASPVRLAGRGRIQSIEFVRNRLEGPANGKMAIAGTERFSISAGLAISSIGFRGRPLDGAPFDEFRGLIPNVAGRVNGDIAGGAPLYVTGWIKRGASGIIGTNRADATETVRTLLTDFRQQRWSVNVDRAQAKTLEGQIDFLDWKRIDEAECISGRKAGRPRRKLVSIEAMIDVAKQDEGGSHVQR